MGWAVAVVGIEDKVGRRKWRPEVGPRMRGASARDLFGLASDPSCQGLGESGSIRYQGDTPLPTKEAPVRRLG